MNRTFPFAVILGISTSIAGSALADTANNTPGEYYITTSVDSTLYFGSSSSPWLYAYHAGGGTDAYLDSDIDAAGNLTNDFGAANFLSHSTAVMGVSAQLKISDFSGAVDFWAGTPFGFTLTAKVNFSGSGITQPCNTPSFTVTLDVTNGAGSWVPAGVAYAGGSNPTGTFRATNTGFTIPALNSGCGGGAVQSALNNDFKLGASGVAAEMVWYGYVSPVGAGSP